jgi:manganese/zinc/iron transport system permease protein
MHWYIFDTWIVLTGALAAMACALPGCFLVLRRMSMMGDAISHAVLPGLALGYLVSGERSSPWLFFFAALAGLLTAFFTQWINRFGKLDRGASMGIVFTSLFAIGLVLIVNTADTVDLDPSCVLYGSLELVPLDVVWAGSIFGVLIEFPRAFLVTGLCFILNFILVVVLLKEWRISSFDPALSQTLGFSSALLHYLLMMMVAVTAVAVFEAVGSILVIAMLIVPPATALLLAASLPQMICWSLLLALISAVLGHLSAILFPPLMGMQSTSTTGSMAVVAGLLFGLVAMLQGVRRRYAARSLAKEPDKVHLTGGLG